MREKKLAVHVNSVDTCGAAMATGAEQRLVPGSDDHGEDGLSEPGAAGSSGGLEAQSPAWLQHVLCALADGQRDLIASKSGHGRGDSKRNLAAVKIAEFSGGSGIAAYAYRTWKKSVQVTARLRKLTDAELALVIFTQVTGKAETMLDILEIVDLEHGNGPSMVWRILDQDREKMEHERRDEAYANWD